MRGVENPQKKVTDLADKIVITPVRNENTASAFQNALHLSQTTFGISIVVEGIAAHNLIE